MAKSKPDPELKTIRPIVGCESCRFYKAIGVHSGQCRRSPPAFHPQASGVMATWPIVGMLDFCGEFQALKSDEEAIHTR